MTFLECSPWWMIEKLTLYANICFKVQSGFIIRGRSHITPAGRGDKRWRLLKRGRGVSQMETPKIGWQNTWRASSHHRHHHHSSTCKSQSPALTVVPVFESLQTCSTILSPPPHEAEHRERTSWRGGLWQLNTGSVRYGYVISPLKMTYNQT